MKISARENNIEMQKRNAIDQYKKLLSNTKKAPQTKDVKNPWLTLTLNVGRKPRPKSILSKVPVRQPDTAGKCIKEKKLNNTESHENHIRELNTKSKYTIENVSSVNIPLLCRIEYRNNNISITKPTVESYKALDINLQTNPYTIQIQENNKEKHIQKRRRSRVNRLVQKTTQLQKLETPIKNGLGKKIMPWRFNNRDREGFMRINELRRIERKVCFS